MKYDESDVINFSKIEKLRLNLINNKSSITFCDFGAMSPDASLTSQEMYEGRYIEKSISQLAMQGVKDEWAKKLYFLVKKFQPKHILELGSCCGFSALYMALASPKSHITTIEGSCEVAQLAINNYKELNVTTITQVIGRFQDVLVPTLNNIKNIDFAFIDGHHDKCATLEYFAMIKPYLLPSSVVVFDDIAWSHGMKEAWATLENDEIFSSTQTTDKFGIGYCR